MLFEAQADDGRASLEDLLSFLYLGIFSLLADKAARNFDRKYRLLLVTMSARYGDRLDMLERRSQVTSSLDKEC